MPRLRSSVVLDNLPALQRKFSARKLVFKRIMDNFCFEFSIVRYPLFTPAEVFSEFIDEGNVFTHGVR